MELKFGPRELTVLEVEHEGRPASLRRGVRTFSYKGDGVEGDASYVLDEVWQKRKLVKRTVKFMRGGDVVQENDLTLDGPPLRAAAVAGGLVDADGNPATMSVPNWLR